MSPEATVAGRVAARAAFVAAALNLLAGMMMLLFLRHGIPAGGSALTDRISFVADNRLAWQLGWLTWNAAAISLLVFYVALAVRWFRDAPLRCAGAVALATAGVAADLIAEAILMVVQPGLDAPSFARMEDIAIALTGFVANGLYTLAGIALTWAGVRALPHRLVLLAVPLWSSGIALSVSVLADSEPAQSASTAVLMPLVVVWVAGVGIWLRHRAS